MPVTCQHLGGGFRCDLLPFLLAPFVFNTCFCPQIGRARASATAMTHTTQTHSSKVPTITFMEQGHQVLRLAFWLTGDPAATIDAVAEALDGHDAADGFFQALMTVWARKLVIAKALGAVHSQLAASIHRTRIRSAGVPPDWDSLPPPAWTARHEVTRAYIDKALLAIDLFPRCTLLLLVFEKLSLDDVSTLLNADKELVKKAEEIAFTELTRNIALEQGWAPTSGARASWTAPPQHNKKISPKSPGSLDQQNKIIFGRSR